MPKKKIVSWLLSLCLLGGLVAMPGVAGAADESEQVDTMTIEWVDDTDATNWNVKLTATNHQDGSYALLVAFPGGGGTAIELEGNLVTEGPKTVDLSGYLLSNGDYVVGLVWKADGNETDIADEMSATLTRTYANASEPVDTMTVDWVDETDEDSWEVTLDAADDHAAGLYVLRMDVNGNQNVAMIELEQNLATEGPMTVDLRRYVQTTGNYAVVLLWVAPGNNTGLADEMSAPLTRSYGAVFVPVTDITIRDTVLHATMRPAKPDPTIRMLLSSTITPVDATNQAITWAIKNDGGTEAWLEKVPDTDWDALCSSKPGTIVITATIEDGTADGTPYTQDFTLTWVPNPIDEIADALDNLDMSKPGDVTNVVDKLEAIDEEQLTSDLVYEDTVAETVAALDAAYAEEVNKSGSTAVDAGAAPAAMAGAQIDAVGLALNAPNLTSTVELVFEEVASADAVTPPDDMDIVQVDVTLWINRNEEHTPKIPLLITMPIPAGLDPATLEVLHYTGKTAESAEFVPFRVDDGKVTFSAASFSVYALVSTKKAPPSGGPSYDHDWSQDLPTVAPPPQEWKPGSPSLTAPVPSAPATNFYRVLARSLNQRGGPGTNYPIMGKLTQNALIQIVGFSEDGQWAQTNAGTWLSMAYLSGTNAASGTGNYVVNVSSSLNVRSGPGTGSSTIGKLYAGASVRALSVENGWAMIEYNGGTAYVSAMYLK